MDVESTLGKGSQYICRIPLKEFQEESCITQRLTEKNNLTISSAVKLTLRILVIEDNPIIQRIYSLLFKRKEIAFDIASNAEMGLNYYMQNHYDLILIDIALPDADGIAITQIIRQQETDNERIPIVALTAYGQSTDQQLFLQAGIDEVLVKPIKLEQMDYLLEKWIIPQNSECSNLN